MLSIGGEYEMAATYLGTAIKNLSLFGRNRAVSLFLRYSGDLHRHRGNFKAAKQDYAKAIHFARLSGSEDMAWFAIVAKTRMDAARKADFKILLKRLEDAEAYADAMELPHLNAEASFVHAQILFHHGETALAAERVSRALRIATLNGLAIRAMEYRSLLADIHRERGWDTIAQKLKADTLQAARSVSYRALLQRHTNESSMDDNGDEHASGELSR